MSAALQISQESLVVPELSLRCMLITDIVRLCSDYGVNAIAVLV